MQSRKAITLLTTWLLMLAVFMAPVIIVATHGPAASFAAAQDMADTISHGHSHPNDQGVFQGHDATDHEHQQSAILGIGQQTLMDATNEAVHMAMTSFEGASPSHPKRPPRA